MATIRSEGNPKRAALILIMSCVINIVLDPIFIFGLGLGIKGAAIATVLSYLAVFIYVFYYYSIGKSNLKLKWIRSLHSGKAVQISSCVADMLLSSLSMRAMAVFNSACLFCASL